MLTTSDTPDGETEDASGRCSSDPEFTWPCPKERRPQLLVFGADAEFSMGQGPPSVTTPELGTLEVGKEVDVTGVEVAVDAVTRLPQDGVSGSADTVLVVTAD